MNLAVVDASVIVSMLINEDDTVVERLSDYDALHSPAHVDVECLSALRGILLGRRMSDDQFIERALAIAGLPVERHAIGPLVPRAAALSFNASSYDGVYIALAELLGADLVTRDQRLAGVPVPRCRVVVI